jgi:ribonuclease T2
MNRIMSRAALAVFGVLLIASAVVAQEPRFRQHLPGKFDFYVLALSWSPSFCQATAERAPDRVPQQQCGARPYAFVVHGLWPQYERGFPEFCQREAPWVDRDIIDSMLDMMPATGLIIQQWKKHGTCSGLGPRAYFETVRKARAMVKIPDDYVELTRPLIVTPDQVEEAFAKTNPGLTRAAMAVNCDERRLREIRICLGKDFRFRECAEIDRRACKRDKLVMPPMRGAATAR